MRSAFLIVSLLVTLAVASTANAAVPTACPGDPIRVDQTVTGEFDTTLQGGYVLVPFEVPAGTTSVRVKYCHDQPENPASAQLRHTLDLGLYQPRAPGITVWGENEFRGWGGSSHPDVTITPQGFSTEEQYKASPRGHVPGRTTRGFKPGDIPAGQWAAELGVAAVVNQADGDADGKVAWRLEIETQNDPAFAAQPYQAAAYDDRPAQRRAGWYEGDLHVHGEHSALGDATMTDVFGYAFGTAGLDFVTLTDYVTDSAWGEVGRYQRAHRGRLIARSSEIITYTGHTNNQVSERYVDYRTGPVYVRAGDGSVSQAQSPRPPSELFDEVHGGGGWTQVNHPTIFPSDQPGNANFCRGCPWDFTDTETDWDKVDAFELQTGPAAFGTTPNPFTPTAISEWDDLLRRGHRVTGVAVSDSHDAGAPNGPTEAPIGNGRTVVYADELSEDGVRRAVQAGHAYIKTIEGQSPDLRLEARAGGRTAIMGDALPGRRARFIARVSGARGTGWTLNILRDGREIDSDSFPGGRLTKPFTANRPGHYRLQVERAGVIHSVSNPIELGAAPRRIPEGLSAGGGRAALRLRVLSVRNGRVTLLVRSNGGAPLGGVEVESGRVSGLTDSRGRVTLRVAGDGRALFRATGDGWRSARATARIR